MRNVSIIKCYGAVLMPVYFGLKSYNDIARHNKIISRSTNDTEFYEILRKILTNNCTT